MELNSNAEQRRYVRYEIFDYASITTSTGVEEWQGLVVDIGLGGLQLRTKEPLPVAAQIFAHVGRENGESVIVHGEVRHCSVMEGTDLFSVGVRFTPSNHVERIQIAELVHEVFQRQREHLTR